MQKNFQGGFVKVSGNKQNIRYGLSASGIQMLLDESSGGDFMELVKLYRGELDC
jgi:hypothetical protein